MSEKYYHLIDQIYDIYINGHIIDTDNDTLLDMIGKYYELNFRYDEMEKYLTLAFEKGNIDALMFMVYYHYSNYQYYRGADTAHYNDTMDQYHTEKMIKYCTIAAERGNTEAMVILGEYFGRRHRDENEMKKYYMMAIKKGNTKAMIKLGRYYDYDGNYYEMKKYYMMAIEKGDTQAMVELGVHYHYEDNNEMKKYYMMAVDKGNIDAMVRLGEYYGSEEKNVSEMIKYYTLAANNGELSDSVMSVLVKFYEDEQDYKGAIRYCLTRIREHRKQCHIVSKYLTNKYILLVIKCLIEIDMDIRDLMVHVDDVYVEIYDMKKKIIGLEKENTELKLRHEVIAKMLIGV